MRSALGVVLLVATATLPAALQSQPGRTRALTIENIFGGQGGGGGVRQVSLSPDGRWIAIAGEGPAGNGVYLMSPAEAQPTKLWFQGNVAAWFPDSQRVVVSRQGDLWSMRVGSTEATPITRDKEDERAPNVSPDGKWIAFYSTRSGHQDLEAFFDRQLQTPSTSVAR